MEAIFFLLERVEIRLGLEGQKTREQRELNFYENQTSLKPQ